MLKRILWLLVRSCLSMSCFLSRVLMKLISPRSTAKSLPTEEASQSSTAQSDIVLSSNTIVPPGDTMISLKKILMSRVEFDKLPKEHQDNLMVLLERINKVCSIYGKPMKVNDGYRRPQDSPNNGSATSWHLKGAAIDIDDNDAG